MQQQFRVGKTNRAGHVASEFGYQKIGFKAPSSVAGFSFYKV